MTALIIERVEDSSIAVHNLTLKLSILSILLNQSSSVYSLEGKCFRLFEGVGVSVW